MFNEDLSATRYVASSTMAADAAVMQVARMIGNGRKVLEIGPATGALTRILVQERGCTVTAIEIDDSAAELVSPLCESIHVANIETCDLKGLLGNQRFDFITFGDVLEHLRGPAAALRKVRDFLAVGGAVVASVPNIAHAAVAFELAHGRFDYRPTGLLDATHIKFFTKRSFIGLFEEAGFLVLNLSRYSRDPEQTEFQVKADTEKKRFLLDYLCAANPEASTYQFIAHAVPADVDGSRAAAEKAAEKLLELEAAVAEERAKVRRLQSEVDWLERRWPYRWLRRTSRTPG